MNWIKGVLSKIVSIFASGRAKAAINTAADFVVKALPIIDTVGSIVVGLTPTTLDDVVLAGIKRRFPGLFDGTVKNQDELKLYALGVATELLKEKYPELSTSVARAAVQLAYTAKSA